MMSIRSRSVFIILLKICLYSAQIEGTMQSVPTKSPTPMVISGLPVSEASRQSPTPIVLLPNSEQKLCQNVKAVTIPTSFITPNQKTSWVVSKITGMKQPLSNFDFSNTNTCSFNSYLPSYCKGLNFVMTTAADGKTSILETYGYNSRSKNLVYFEHKMTLADKNYLIYQSPEITKMEYISAGGNIQPATIPETVKMSQGVPFAIIALEPTFKYAVFQSCDLKTAWVAFSEELINSQPDIAVLDAYEKEIEDSLYRHGIDVSAMIDIDFSFHQLNNLVMATNPEPLVGSLTLKDVEKEFIKLMCKMLT